MIDVEEDMELLRKTGRFGSEEEFLEEAFRALLKEKPELRIELAIERYKSGDVSLNRAIDIAGSSPEEFKEILAERGIVREAGFLSDNERESNLSKL
jgi:predicted HTH domain antitoxin